MKGEGRGKIGGDRGEGVEGRGKRGGVRGGGAGTDARAARHTFIAQCKANLGLDHGSTVEAWKTSSTRQQLINQMGISEAKRRKMI